MQSHLRLVYKIEWNERWKIFIITWTRLKWMNKKEKLWNVINICYSLWFCVMATTFIERKNNSLCRQMYTRTDKHADKNNDNNCRTKNGTKKKQLKNIFVKYNNVFNFIVFKFRFCCVHFVLVFIFLVDHITRIVLKP